MNDQNLQSLTADQFFYFFLRLRKGEIRRTVQQLKSRHPDETPEQLARRLIEAKAQLTLVGGLLLSVPVLLPGMGQALKWVGMVGGTSALTRMNLYLILEIALVYGKNIDEKARVPEMVAVVAASGLAAASPLLVQALNWNPMLALPAGGLTATAVTRMIGDASIRHYGEEASALAPAPAPLPAS